MPGQGAPRRVARSPSAAPRSLGGGGGNHLPFPAAAPHRRPGRRGAPPASAPQQAAGAGSLPSRRPHTPAWGGGHGASGAPGLSGVTRGTRGASRPSFPRPPPPPPPETQGPPLSAYPTPCLQTEHPRQALAGGTGSKEDPGPSCRRLTPPAWCGDRRGQAAGPGSRGLCLRPALCCLLVPDPWLSPGWSREPREPLWGAVGWAGKGWAGVGGCAGSLHPAAGAAGLR